ncbi:unnamed protein product [Rotaria magnacalcarata]|uniref:Uncharacterized protein n=1 Tax=Rotaria magnacalcarata TaxID=392030 RepID=A0A815HLN7_9BILA|nr:unnamed protein product [Rotaria magnacalcarata]
MTLQQLEGLDVKPLNIGNVPNKKWPSNIPQKSTTPQIIHTDTDKIEEVPRRRRSCFFWIILIGLILIGILVAVIVVVMIVTKLMITTTATITITTTTATTITTTTTPTVHIFWSFDSTLQDLYNNFNGIGINTPGYSSPGYNGAGACLWLNQSLSQSVTINTTFLNMAYTSFTLEVWAYANSLHNNNPYTDNAVFGQFQQNIQDHSLHIIIRNQRIYLGFFSDDLQGNQVSRH